MKYDKDVFISYAHLDDKPLDEGAKGWITDFHSLLETRLEQTIGHEILIWRDAELTGNEVFANEIEAQLPTLKLMVSIITPRYLGSEWCKREMGAFYDAARANGGISIGNKSRFFKIVKTPVERAVIEKLPKGIYQVFDEILDYKFYFNEPATGKFRELSRQSWVDNAIKQEYMNKLDDVVQDMANLIRQFNNDEEKKGEKEKIYLAEASYDLEIYRDNLVRELEEAGFAVLPDKNLPFIANKFTAEVERYLDESMLAIHLISHSTYALQPEGADKSIVMLQNEIAAARSASAGLKRLIWLPPASEAPSGNETLLARQSAFVHELKTNPDYQKGADVLMGPLEEFKQAIFDTVRRIKAEEEAKKTAAVPTQADTGTGSGAAKVVYLICDQRDLDATMPLEDLLSENGCEILLPLFEGDNAQLRQAHLDNLKICDAVLIYYGAGNYRWAGSMKSDLMRLPAMGRSAPLLEKAVYLAGPRDADKERFRSNDMPLINGMEEFNPDALHDFIQKLK